MSTIGMLGRGWLAKRAVPWIGETRFFSTGESTNWCRNISFKHKHWRVPETDEELQHAVREAAQVRVLGSGHSFSSLCCSNDTLISLAFMRNILDLNINDESDIYVVVEGGATLGDVVKYLAPRGMALKNIPSLPHITVAGGLATATHGSGVQAGAEAGLPSMCRFIEFVTHDGEVKRVDRGDADFHRAVVHLGLLGVVSRVALDVVPSYDVDQRVYTDVPLDQLILRFEECVNSADSVTAGINFGVCGGRGKGLLWMRYFGTPSGTAPLPIERSQMFLGGSLRTSPVPFYESQTGVPSTRSGPWHDVCSFFMDNTLELNMPKVAVQSEWFVPLSSAGEALNAVREVARHWEGWPQSEDWKDLHEGIQVFHCEVRAIAADGLGGMCPFSDLNRCSIHFTWGGWEHRTRILEMVEQVERALEPYDARAHMGKLNLATSKDLEASYGTKEMQQFRDLCDRNDPNGKFRNSLLRSQIWGEGYPLTEYQ